MSHAKAGATAAGTTGTFTVEEVIREGGPGALVVLSRPSPTDPTVHATTRIFTSEDEFASLFRPGARVTLAVAAADKDRAHAEPAAGEAT